MGAGRLEFGFKTTPQYISGKNIEEVKACGAWIPRKPEIGSRYATGMCQLTTARRVSFFMT
jgi:hypothetical protein